MLKDCWEKYYYEENYNCAESILRAANDYYSLGLHDRDMKLIGGYGGGIQTDSLCGAYLAAVSVLSMKYIDEKAHESMDIRPAVRYFTGLAEERLATLDCSELRPMNTRPGRRCGLTVETVCEALEQAIDEYEAEKNGAERS